MKISFFTTILFIVLPLFAFSQEGEEFYDSTPLHIRAYKDAPKGVDFTLAFDAAYSVWDVHNERHYSDGVMNNPSFGIDLSVWSDHIHFGVSVKFLQAEIEESENLSFINTNGRLGLHSKNKVLQVYATYGIFTDQFGKLTTAGGAGFAVQPINKRNVTLQLYAQANFFTAEQPFEQNGNQLRLLESGIRVGYTF